MKTIRVVVVDDSAYNRRAITKMLEELPGVQVVGYATNGEEGIRRVIDLTPDLVTLDLEMPRMDGFTMLRILMASTPVPTIVISSTSGDEKVFKALELGAVDFIAKPTTVISDELLKIQKDLHEKVQGVFKLNMARVQRRSEPVAQAVVELPTTPAAQSPATLDLVAIGSSTGGPPALQRIFSAFPEPLPFAVAIAQHMPPGFTTTFAERLNRLTGFEVREAKDGDEVLPGRALLAPGGKNLLFVESGGKVVARVVEPEPKYRYVPSVDAMFASLSEIYRKRMLAVVLTGMGNDGAQGVRQAKRLGAQVIAESEETAVVYGMPREAVATGQVDRVVPIDAMVREIVYRCGLMPRFG
ncbi:chemotaxis response regulator protein-glutamate methylesterase of group 3 operon [Geomonas limicola]|uniref:Protein-glutamate methylesterase/protein-glutamine glutaminase n=1 Tax=Geomonas limicola TaxID=2740186 RepID=A0A6V8N9H2_9BACT|nr:chemotaxis response regulator protein-glutamate methylesterase [Geomonas limicola]GFO68447.1 chemotaxis response regulator protein-glutamate methylesterase of group 3 operon [Geomonas limicola]